MCSRLRALLALRSSLLSAGAFVVFFTVGVGFLEVLGMAFSRWRTWPVRSVLAALGLLSTKKFKGVGLLSGKREKQVKTWLLREHTYIYIYIFYHIYLYV